MSEGPVPHLVARLAGLSAIALALMAGYATARPSVESLFLAEWGADALPWAWMGVAAGALAATAAWGRAARRMELAALLGVVAAISAGLLAVLLLLHGAGLRAASFLLYVWKDVYIVVLVETFYAFANVVFPLRSARWAYGLFGAMGSVGGIAGNLLVGRLAAALGTAATPWLLIPDLAVVVLLARWLSRRAGAQDARVTDAAERPGLREGARVVLGSRYLVLVLAMVATVQIATNVLDFAYNSALQAAVPDTDARTAVIGQVYAAIDGVALACNLLTGLILRGLGVTGTVLALPLVLATAVGAALATPGFLAVAAAKVANKAFDYSLFRASKEALYLPLSYREKTQGKAIVDVLTYRVSKGAASALVLGLVAVSAQGAALWLVAGLVALWLGLAAALARRARATGP